MISEEKCDVCGRWSETTYMSKYTFNKLRWMGRNVTYKLCSDCAKETAEKLDDTMDYFKNKN